MIQCAPAYDTPKRRYLITIILSKDDFTIKKTHYIKKVEVEGRELIHVIHPYKVFEKRRNRRKKPGL